MLVATSPGKQARHEFAAPFALGVLWDVHITSCQTCDELLADYKDAVSVFKKVHNIHGVPGEDIRLAASMSFQ